MKQQNKKNKNKTNISLLLLTHNEEGSLLKNFDWLAKCPNINEIVVVDDYSTDKSLETIKSVAKNISLKIKSRGLDRNFAAQRQFGAKQATNDWILWLDPDEKPSKKLVRFLNHFDGHKHAYSFKRKEKFLGKIS